jgi:hypothetical protein
MRRLACLLFLALTAPADAAEPVVQPALPLDVVVPAAPAWVDARDGRHALYELHIANYRAFDLELLGLEITAAPGTALRSYRDAELEEILERPGTKLEGADKRQLHGGESAVAYIELIVPANAPPVPEIRNRILARRLPEKGAEPGDKVYALDVEPVKVSATPRLIGPPLRGSGWLAANGMSNNSNHRRALIPVNGHARIAQRFAIDLIQIGPNGKLMRDDAKGNEAFFCYGQELLAVADGTVIDTRDGIVENVPFEHPAVEITLDTIAGNYVVLDIGDAYVLYGHAKPGTIRVRAGQRVKRGDVLAQLGNSGNSDAPHLHLHVMDRPSPLGAEGLPFLFQRLETSGRIPDLDRFLAEQRTWTPSFDPPVAGARALPLDGDVINFP